MPNEDDSFFISYSNTIASGIPTKSAKNKHIEGKKLGGNSIASEKKSSRESQ